MELYTVPTPPKQQFITPRCMQCSRIYGTEPLHPRYGPVSNYVNLCSPQCVKDWEEEYSLNMLEDERQS